MKVTEQVPDQTAPSAPGLAWLPLCLALAILIVMTLLPAVATAASGNADHPAAMLLCAAMCAGFVRGVGFIPRHVLPRVLLSTPAALLSFVLALWRLTEIGRLPAVF
ncbi:MAG: cyd operon YbgE family protein [Accumulibacter sp.]|uniref:cyd operon YbgE family protein n=1 Tax=Accumulibacter sp. TaxID=2053492 RepID=UPI0033164A3C